MKRVAGMGADLSVDEGNLLSAAFKRNVGERRTAYREVAQLEAKLRQEKQAVGDLVKDYKLRVADDLVTKCTEVIDVLSKEPFTEASDIEAKVEYAKMKGDYYRYMCEAASGEQQVVCSKEGLDAYQAATAIAESSLPPTHPLRLGLVLNFSVFYNEVHRSPEMACQVARKTYDQVSGIFSEMPEEECPGESVHIVQMLKDNLQMWMFESQPAEGSKAPERDGTACEDL